MNGENNNNNANANLHSHSTYRNGFGTNAVVPPPVPTDSRPASPQPNDVLHPMAINEIPADNDAEEVPRLGQETEEEAFDESSDEGTHEDSDGDRDENSDEDSDGNSDVDSDEALNEDPDENADDNIAQEIAEALRQDEEHWQRLNAIARLQEEEEEIMQNIEVINAMELNRLSFDRIWGSQEEDQEQRGLHQNPNVVVSNQHLQNSGAGSSLTISCGLSQNQGEGSSDAPAVAVLQEEHERRIRSYHPNYLGEYNMRILVDNQLTRWFRDQNNLVPPYHHSTLEPMQLFFSQNRQQQQRLLRLILRTRQQNPNDQAVNQNLSNDNRLSDQNRGHGNSNAQAGAASNNIATQDQPVVQKRAPNGPGSLCCSQFVRAGFVHPWSVGGNENPNDGELDLYGQLNSPQLNFNNANRTALSNLAPSQGIFIQSVPNNSAELSFAYSPVQCFMIASFIQSRLYGATGVEAIQLYNILALLRDIPQNNLVPRDYRRMDVVPNYLHRMIHNLRFTEEQRRVVEEIQTAEDPIAYARLHTPQEVHLSFVDRMRVFIGIEPSTDNPQRK